MLKLHDCALHNHAIAQIARLCSTCICIGPTDPMLSRSCTVQPIGALKSSHFGEFQHGQCSHRGQKKHFKDTFKVLLKVFNINHNFWEQIDMDICKGGAAFCSAVKSHETNRTVVAEKCRQDRKCSASKSRTAVTIPCLYCGRTF